MAARSGGGALASTISQLTCTKVDSVETVSKSHTSMLYSYIADSTDEDVVVHGGGGLPKDLELDQLLELTQQKMGETQRAPRAVDTKVRRCSFK